MPRPLSDSWQYFELLSPDNGRNRKARCTFCGHEQAAGITRLHQHLLYRCSKISADIRDQLRQKQEDRSKTESVSSIRSTDMLQQRHLQQQPPQQVDYHFDPTLQNTLNHHNSYYETSGTASNSSSNHTMSPTHTHFSTSAPPYPLVTTNTHHSDSHPTAAFQPASSSTATNSTTNSLGGGGMTTPPTASLPSTTQHADTTNRSQAMLDWQLARALFSANIPFESIENPMMVEFFKRLQPNYVVPKGKRLLQYLLKEQHWDLIRWDNENTTNSAALRLSSSAPSGVRGASHSMMNHNNTNRLLSSLHSPDLEGNL
ncbi:MAG: hypothetical protein EXX96DRAFT_547834 [Benjaminiella poitrasii]|nr:MAG: hypothetical protein EXX96DRAFT_547834 [Benjaminiella poitrasii]